MLRGLGLCAIAVTAACYEPPVACGITCAASNECPGDATCTAGVCVPPGGTCAGLELRAIGAGTRHVCALDGDGHLYCWGDNRLGQVGTGGDLVVPAPARVSDDVWDQLSVGAEHSCA